MALDPKSKDTLARFTMIAKNIIYEPKRMESFMQMMGTPKGAVTAVQTVIAIIEHHADVPDKLEPILGVNIYLAMVDIAQESTQHKADPGIMKTVIASIIDSLTKGRKQFNSLKQRQAAQAPQQTPQPAPRQAPQGLMASMQGAPA